MKQAECKDERDQVEHPTHYTHGSIEVWDAITDWNLPFCEGNVVKYVARASHHAAGRLTNLRKAQQYLTKAIEVEESRCTEQKERASNQGDIHVAERTTHLDGR